MSDSDAPESGLIAGPDDGGASPNSLGSGMTGILPIHTFLRCHDWLPN